jgi:hypothetical protein
MNFVDFDEKFLFLLYNIIIKDSRSEGRQKGEKAQVMLRRHCGRVVKAMDLKSIGFSRAGSNPANVVFFLLVSIFSQKSLECTQRID